MNEGKIELYKFIIDQHDKLLTARESLASRYGNIRLLAGLLLTVFSFSISVIIKSIENAQGDLPRLITALPLLFFFIALYYVSRALLAVPDLVGNVPINIPLPDKNVFIEGFEKDKLSVDRVLIDLSSNYLDAINENRKQLDKSREALEKCIYFIRRGLFSTIIFLSLTLLSSLAVMWLFTKR